MKYQFNQHYTVAEARALLPDIRTWLSDIRKFQKAIQLGDDQFKKRMSGGDDLGGPIVDEQMKRYLGLGRTLQAFKDQQIQIKEIGRGLVDFPAMQEGEEAFLCWEESEDDILFWHKLEDGFSGRRPILNAKRPSI